jgi:hypothetical protein
MSEMYNEVLNEDALEEILQSSTVVLRAEGLPYFWINRKKRGYLLSSVVEFFKNRQITDADKNPILPGYRMGFSQAGKHKKVNRAINTE